MVWEGNVVVGMIEEGGSFPGYGWCGLWWWSEALFEGDAMCVCVLGMLGIGNS